MQPLSLAMLLLKVLLIIISGPEIEDAATESRRVAAERAVNDGQRRGVGVQDATSFAALTVPDRQAGNRHRFTCNSLEDTAGGVTVYGQHTSAGAVDYHALVHE